MVNMNNIREAAEKGRFTKQFPPVAAVSTVKRIIKGPLHLSPCIYGNTVCWGNHLWGLSWGALGSKVLIVWSDLLIRPLLSLLLSIYKKWQRKHHISHKMQNPAGKSCKTLLLWLMTVLVLCEHTQDLWELIQQVVLVHSSLLPDGQNPTQLFLTAVLAISGQGEMRQNRRVN